MQLNKTIMNATYIKRNKKTRGRPKGATVKFPGVGEDAKVLRGVFPSNVWQ